MFNELLKSTGNVKAFCVLQTKGPNFPFKDLGPSNMDSQNSFNIYRVVLNTFCHRTWYEYFKVREDNHIAS